MNRISLRERLVRAGAWIHKPARSEQLAGGASISIEDKANPFLYRKLRPGYSSLRGTLTGGTDSTQIISDDRDSR